MINNDFPENRPVNEGVTALVSVKTVNSWRFAPAYTQDK
jgi:hypothetical protein